MIHHYPVNHTSDAVRFQTRGLQQYFTEENVERLTGIMYSKKVKKAPAFSGKR